ncbi:MAG: hypothetical protein R2744_11285 [Bacteroidales bacterium]
MKRLLLFVAIIPSLLVAQQPDNNAVLRGMHSISSHDLLEYVRIQCDDKYAGRLTGTDEYMACAEWLAGFFGDNGLKPYGDNGSWFQYYDLDYTLVHPGCDCLHIPQKKRGAILKHYEYVSEFMPGSTSVAGR